MTFNDSSEGNSVHTKNEFYNLDANKRYHVHSMAAPCAFLAPNNDYESEREGGKRANLPGEIFMCKKSYEI